MHKSSNFQSIFFKNEYRALVGNKHTTIVRLVLLLTVTLVALGFSVGGLNQLRSKMNNPFTNWVDLEVGSKGPTFLSDVKRCFSYPDTLKGYHLDHVDGWNSLNFSFYTKNYDYVHHKVDTFKFYRYGRTINMRDSMFYAILNPNSNNVVYKNENAFDENQELVYPCGLIITESLAKKLGYTNYKMLQKIKLCTNDDKILFQDLIAVVKQLPNQAHFVCSPTVYTVGERTNSVRCNDMFQEDDDRELNQFEILSDSRAEYEFIDQGIHQYFTVTKDYSIYGPNEIMVDSSKSYYTYQVNLLDSAHPTLTKKKDLLRYLFETGRYKPYYSIDCGEDCESIANPHYLSFNFNNLDKIRQFQALMSDNFGGEVPMHQVEAKENFHAVTNLTSLLSFVLLVLSVLSILLYLGNLLFNHIESIKSNLGTFKAFGLPNVFLRNLYISIVLSMLCISLLISIPLAFWIGYVLDTKLLNIGFQLFSVEIVGTLMLVFLVCIIITSWVLKVKLSATPGDLIYER